MFITPDEAEKLVELKAAMPLVVPSAAALFIVSVDPELVVSDIVSAPDKESKVVTTDPPVHEPKLGVPPFISCKQSVPAPPAAETWMALVPFPYKIPLLVKVDVPVPPLATVRGLDKVSEAKVGESPEPKL